VTINLTADQIHRYLTKIEGADDALARINVWLERGDAVVVYTNNDLGHPELGHPKFLSFGSDEAAFPEREHERPPANLPDFGGQINWRYCLDGMYRGPALEVQA